MNSPIGQVSLHEQEPNVTLRSDSEIRNWINKTVLYCREMYPNSAEEQEMLKRDILFAGVQRTLYISGYGRSEQSKILKKVKELTMALDDASVYQNLTGADNAAKKAEYLKVTNTSFKLLS